MREFLSSCSQCLEKAHQWSALLLFLTCPFYFNEIQRWALVAFFVIAIVRLLLQLPQIKFECNCQRAAFGCLAALFVLLLCYRPLESNLAYWNMLVEQRLPYIGFGLAGLLGLRMQLKVERFAYAGLLATVAIVVFVLCLMPWSGIDSLQAFENSFNEVRQARVHAHMAFNIFLSVVMLLQIHMADCAGSKPQKALFIGATAFVYLLMVNSDGRIGLVAANIILLMAIVRIFKIRIRLLLTMLPLVLLVAALTIFQHPKFRASFEPRSNPRVYIWQLSVHKIAEHPWLGRGASTTIDEMLTAMPADEGLSASCDMRLLTSLRAGETIGAHPHNMYMQVWMEYGLPGVLVLLSLLLLTFLALLGKEQAMLTVSLWCIVCIQLLTETVHTSMGETAFGLYLYLMMQLPSKNRALDQAQADE